MRRQSEREKRSPTALGEARGGGVIKGPFDERGNTMAEGFLTAAERDRLGRFPAHIPEDDLSAFFLLSEADHHAVSSNNLS